MVTGASSGAGPLSTAVTSAPEPPWYRHYDPGVPRALAAPAGAPRSVFELLARAAADRPRATAFHFLGRRTSYAELRRQALACAGALAALGVQPGERVAIHLPNLPQTVVAYYGALAAGAVVVFTNPLYTALEIEHQWRDAGVRAAVTADFLLAERVEPLFARLALRGALVASIPEALPWPTSWLARWKLARAVPPRCVPVRESPGVQRVARAVARARPLAAAVPRAASDTAVIQYTGGTTGVAKGALLTHANLVANVRQVDHWFRGARGGELLAAGEPAEVIVAVLPLFHVFGMTVGLNWPISMGAELVLLPDARDSRALLAAIERHRATLLPAVPAMFASLAELAAERPRALASLRGAMSGSAPLPAEVQRRFESCTRAKIVEGYGLSETSPVTHVNPYHGLRKNGSIGVPVSGTDAALFDPEHPGQPAAAGRAGELALRGPQVTAGYWGRPDETSQAFASGWFLTGDLATVDDDGYFRIVGRKKDMINAGGYKVFPDEVDRHLAGHPAILESATIGVPHARRGETVKSFVVLRPGARLTVEEVRDHCRAALAPYKVPGEVEFLSELPKSTVLKVLRRELRARELARRAAAGG
jgi:long-chain acyl-CoA synthetase